MKRRTIVLTGKIDRSLVIDVGKRLILLNTLSSTDLINLIIDSEGGCQEDALHLCDVMSVLTKASIRGIALGDCGSAATFVMLHCDERMSTPHARFLIHSGVRRNISLPLGKKTLEELQLLQQDIQTGEESVIRLYMNRLTPTSWRNRIVGEDEKRAFVETQMERGDRDHNYHLTAEQALDIGLIESIATEDLNIF